VALTAPAEPEARVGVVHPVGTVTVTEEPLPHVWLPLATLKEKVRELLMLPATTVVGLTVIVPPPLFPPPSVKVVSALSPEDSPLEVSCRVESIRSSVKTYQEVIRFPFVSATASQGSYSVPGAGPAIWTIWLLTVSFGRKPEPLISTVENGG
jgi:hypothetical protein